MSNLYYVTTRVSAVVSALHNVALPDDDLRGEIIVSLESHRDATANIKDEKYRTVAHMLDAVIDVLKGETDV